MGIQKIENVKIVCVVFFKAKDAYNDFVKAKTAAAPFTKENYPYLGKIFCKKCAAKVLASALYRVTHFKIDAERAAKAFAKGTLVKASMEVEEKEAAK